MKSSENYTKVHRPIERLTRIVLRSPDTPREFVFRCHRRARLGLFVRQAHIAV